MYMNILLVMATILNEINNKSSLFIERIIISNDVTIILLKKNIHGTATNCLRIKNLS